MKYLMKHSGRGILAVILVATLAACDWGNDEETPAEDEKITLPPPPANAKYSGRVIDGYLRNATVWLDLNNNWIPDANEPTTQTLEYGRFVFSEEDLVGIERPEDYPLMVHAKRDITVDEGLIQDGNADSGRLLASFFLAAPPSVTTVTPLTTLVKLELDALQQDPKLADDEKTLSQAQARVQQDLGIRPSMSLLNNYIGTQNVPLYAIARGLIANLQWGLANLSPDPSVDPLSLLQSEDYVLLGQALRTHAKALAEDIDEHLEQAFGLKPTMAQVAGMDVSPLINPDLLLSLLDVQVLTEINWYVHPNTVSGTLTTFSWASVEPPLADLQPAARARQSFNLLGQITDIEVDGWLAVGVGPSLQQGADYGLQIDFSQPISIPDTEVNFHLENSFEKGRVKQTEVLLLQDEATAPPSLQSLATAPIRHQYDASGRLSKVVMADSEGERTLTYRYEQGALTEILEEVVLTTDTPPTLMRQFLTRHSYDENNNQRTSSESFIATAGQELDLSAPVASSFYIYDANGKVRHSCTIVPEDLDRCWHFEYEGDRLKYSYLEAIPPGEEPRGPDGAVIVLLTYNYEPLKDVAQ